MSYELSPMQGLGVSQTLSGPPLANQQMPQVLPLSLDFHPFQDINLVIPHYLVRFLLLLERCIYYIQFFVQLFSPYYCKQKTKSIFMDSCYSNINLETSDRTVRDTILYYCLCLCVTLLRCLNCSGKPCGVG